MSDGTGIHRQALNQDRLWSFYQNENLDVFRANSARLEYLARCLQPGMRTLDIGIGNAAFERAALPRGLDVYALDPDARAIERARSDLRLGERAQAGSCTAIPFKSGFFDAVVVSEVLEHLTPAEAACSLREIHRVLRPGGSVLGTVPAREDLAAQQILCPACGVQFHRWGHQQSFTLGNARSLLVRHAFRIQRLEERYFVAWGAVNWKGKLHSALKLGLLQVGIHGSNESIFFRAAAIK